MANIIPKILDAETLFGVGALIAFIGQAAYVPAFISSLFANFIGIGYLLIVISAVMVIIKKFAK